MPESSAPESECVLRVRKLSATYHNGAQGIHDVNLDLHKGEVVAVFGRNGAGKTSLLRSITGFLRSEHVRVVGEVALGGAVLKRHAPAANRRHGLCLVQERDKVFPSLTVAEHLRLAGMGKKQSQRPLLFPELERLMSSHGSALSGGERQMLALEGTWQSSPKVLLVDELSLGLAPVIVKRLLERLVDSARGSGTAVVIVEQDARSALGAANRVYVMERGEVAWTGLSSETNASELARRYLGTSR